MPPNSLAAEKTASHALLWAWIEFTSRWTLGVVMLVWHYPTLPPCPLRGSYCASLNLLPPFHVSHCVYMCVYVWDYVCQCVCVGLTQFGWTLKYCPSANGPRKTNRLGHLSAACVLWLLFFFWMESYCLFKVCDLAKSSLPNHTLRFILRLTRQAWHRKAWRTLGRKTMGTLMLTGNDARRRRRPGKIV